MTMNHKLMPASDLTGYKVNNPTGESLGKIEDFMLDVKAGRISYAVLSFGGVMGIGDKLFAIPIAMLSLDEEEKLFYLNIDKEKLKDAPGFDKGNWPDTGDAEFHSRVNTFYDIDPN